MKNRKLVLWILFFILTGYTSCVKEFFPHIDKYDELLVVEGTISDKPGPYTVKLSLSSNVLQDPSYKPYPNCIVEIRDTMGNQEKLTEVTKGEYKTDSLGIQGVAGRKYKIKISTPDGEVYESQQDLLHKGVGIQSVNPEYEHKNDNSFFGRDGYQFYIDAP